MEYVISTVALLYLSFPNFVALKVNSDGLHGEIPIISKFSSIETVHGDIYDCIDVYKQYSLTHPALQGHKIKMKPSREISATFAYSRINVSNDNINVVDFNPAKLWKLKKGCPKGTIPIRRNDRNNSRDNFPHSFRLSGIDFAGIYSKPGPKIFYSAASNINLYNPKVYSNQQYSSAIIYIERGEPPLLEQIQVGWTVNPGLYGDYRTRLFTAWTSDNYQNTGCFNTKCPGFVVVNNNIPLDYAFSDISVREGKQFETPLNIFVEPGVGWWFVVGPENSHIGYWPIQLFPNMKDNATIVAFGGQVFTPPTDDYDPQMGSGRFKNGQYDKTCYMRRVMVTDETHVSKDIDNSFIDATDSHCYYEGDYSFKNNINRYSFVFGGKGGKDGVRCIYPPT